LLYFNELQRQVTPSDKVGAQDLTQLCNGVTSHPRSPQARLGQDLTQLQSTQKQAKYDSRS
jgi:hypothetical protein